MSRLMRRKKVIIFSILAFAFTINVSLAAVNDPGCHELDWFNPTFRNGRSVVFLDKKEQHLIENRKISYVAPDQIPNAKISLKDRSIAKINVDQAINFLGYRPDFEKGEELYLVRSVKYSPTADVEVYLYNNFILVSSFGLGISSGASYAPLVVALDRDIDTVYIECSGAE